MQELKRILEEIDREVEEYMEIDFGDEYNAGIKDMAKMSKKIIEKHMNDDWIPVEERLPEVDEDTEETIEDDDCPEYIVTIRGATESTTLKYSPDGTWFDENGYVYDVIAWRPLPGPYRPVDKTAAPNWREDMLRKFDRRD